MKYIKVPQLWRTWWTMKDSFARARRGGALYCVRDCTSDTEGFLGQMSLSLDMQCQLAMAWFCGLPVLGVRDGHLLFTTEGYAVQDALLSA